MIRNDVGEKKTVHTAHAIGYTKGTGHAWGFLFWVCVAAVQIHFDTRRPRCRNTQINEHPGLIFGV